MILKTFLNGKAVNGFTKKSIIHPYSGMSVDSVEYSRNIRIDPFENVKDIRTFRSDLNAVAASTCVYFGKRKTKILKTVSDETGSPIFYHEEDMGGVRMFLKKLGFIEKLLPKEYVFEPKGNVLLILASNEPIISATILIFSSLFMGNTVFVKPSSKTPSYAHLLVKELAKNPILKKRVHCLLVDREETERLIQEKSFDFVLSFASRTTNKRLGVVCAEAEVVFLPESEGNDWVYVDKNYKSLKKTGKILVRSFVRHNGQMCNAVRGILVHSSMYASLVEELKKHLSVLPVGNPQLKTTRIGTVLAGTSANANLLVKEAAATASSIWNFSAKENVITPALILDPGDISPIFSESIFAPVLWIKKVENYSEAISFYQRKNLHGLGFSVFSDDKKVIDQFITGLRVGRVNINKDPMNIGLFEPLGGVKISGRDGPSQWVEKLSNRKYISK